MVFDSLVDRLPRGLVDKLPRGLLGRRPESSEQHATSTESPAALNFDQPTERDIRALYARLRPDQRTAIGGEFIRLFRLSGDPAAQEFVKPITGMLSVDQLTTMHLFARDHLPQVLAKVRAHPVTQDALAHPGEEAPPAEQGEAIIQEPIEVEGQGTSDEAVINAEVGREGLFMAETGTHLLGGRPSPASDIVRTPEGETESGAEILEAAEREGPLTNPADHGG